MLVIMESDVSDEQIQNVIERMIALGFDVHRSSGMNYTVLGGIGDVQKFDALEFRAMPGVHEAIRISKRWKLAAIETNPAGTRVRIGSAELGGKFAILPGDGILREVWESNQVRVLSTNADALVVPASAMENQALLRELGRAGVPVILKRSETASVDDWLTAADVILQSGNPEVVMCESGVRAFTGRLLDIGAIAELRAITHLPVIAAPYGLHDRVDVIAAIREAAIAAGAQGILQ
jgi:3-deoxy-7-phosphoheptulonate synthase